MRRPGKLIWALGLGLGVLLVTVVVVRTWVVPAVIVGQIQKRSGGTVAIRDWWLNGRSAGVVGLTVREGPAPDAPVWASAEKVTTDLSLGGLLRGRFGPTRITMDRPVLSLKFGDKGNLLTKVGGASKGGAGAGPIPVVVAQGAKITAQQEGRPAMVVTNVTARIGPNRDKVLLSVQSNDPDWGPIEAHGETDGAFRSGTIDLKSTRPLRVSTAKVKAIPFVPADVWQNVAPEGDVDVALKVVLDAGTVKVRTELALRGTAVRSEGLDLTATGATGRVIVDDTLVTFKDVTGRAIDGRVKANGSADFGRSPARFDLALRLDGINVADAPKSWQLDEAGVTGRLSGDVRILALLKPDGVDLSGTSGEAVVDQGTIQGIPFKALTLLMTATGKDLQYGTGPTKGKTGQHLTPSGSAPSLAGTAVRSWFGDVPRRRTFALLGGLATVAVQAPEPKHEPARPAVTLPKSITTHLELEDVDLVQLITKAQFLLGFPFPVPVTGRLSLKADATIPLRKGSTIKDYEFHGDLTLARASVYKVDLGKVSAHLELADGSLDLTELRGRLIDNPDGGPDNPPTAEGAEVPLKGPLPPGTFRGSLRAGLSPPGKLTAKFDGNQLPLGELAAPALPRPTPLSGLASLSVSAEADLSAATDPKAWNASGTVQSQQIHYKGAALAGVSVQFGLKDGRLDVPDLHALLRDRPLRAKLGVDLAAPRAFQGVVDVAGWELAEILAWVPGAPRSSPVAGTLSARAEATGTLSPFSVKTDGRGSFERLQAGPVALGAVPFHWTTKDDVVDLAITDARPFGGRVSAEAAVPLSPGKPIAGSATIAGIDTAAMSAAVPGGGLKLTGRASGKVTFSVPADVSALDAVVNLSAPDLTVQGVPAEQVKASVRAKGGTLGYKISADSLGGVIRFEGDFPLGAAGAAHNADGELRAIGFTLDRVWRALGVSGAVARVEGRGAIDTNLRAVMGGRTPGLYAHGIAELRDLRWGDRVSLGWLRGVMVMTPGGWRVDPIGGDLMNGVASGFLWGSALGAESQRGQAGAPTRVGFNVRVDRAELEGLEAFLPARSVSLRGYGTLRMAGTLGHGLHAVGDLHVPSSKVNGFPVAELKVPAEVAGAGDGGGVIHVRRYSARVAGGQVHGDASLHFGADRGFKAHVVLTDVDLESITRMESDARRPASGKITGRVSVSGHDVESTRSYRGRINLTLDDASLVALPVFRELDKFLGSARGGLFEQGELTGSIANRQIVIESATLMGRVAQLHVSGTVGFDSQLNLEVLVNTNQIIPQAGSAIASALPGVGNARDRDATLQATNYLSNRLLKFRVSGNLKSPTVNLDPSVAVAGPAVGFFSGVLKLPLGLIK